MNIVQISIIIGLVIIAFNLGVYLGRRNSFSKRDAEIEDLKLHNRILRGRLADRQGEELKFDISSKIPKTSGGHGGDRGLEGKTRKPGYFPE